VEVGHGPVPTTPEIYVSARACAVLSTRVVAEPVPVMMPYRKSVLNEVSVTETVVSRSQEKYTGLVLGMTDLHPTYPAYENPLSRHVSTSSTSKFDGGETHNGQQTTSVARKYVNPYVGDTVTVLVVYVVVVAGA
jgi:hypothetical protein